jgi:7-carboxy-7-deazaguanine synthase
LENNRLQITYPLMEHFYTLQGEGFNSGKAAYFLRLGGCDVGCVWCDVKESWDASVHPQVSVASMLQLVLQAKAKNVVITGGEPSMYDLSPICDELHEHGIKVWIETAGVYPIRGNFDWICLSPKKFKKPLSEVLSIANELKIIVFNKTDLPWAEKFEIQVPEHCHLFLQPEWGKSESMNPVIRNFIENNPHWRLSLQTHKYLNIP